MTLPDVSPHPLTAPAPPGPDIEVADLSITYGRGDTAVHAIRNLSLKVPAGQFVCVMGPSGSGKTSLFNALAATLQPTAGSIRVGDIDVSGMDDDRAAQYRLREVGLVHQFFNLIPELNLERNIGFPLHLQGAPRDQIEQRVDELLDYLGIAHRRRHLPLEVSGGEMQRVAIGRAIAIRPKLILADEPTGNVDTRTGEEILALLRDICEDRGVTVILFTHDLRAVSYADRIITLVDGQIDSDQGPESAPEE